MATYGYEQGIQIHPAENGFIVIRANRSWVFNNLKTALKFIEESLTETAA
jgi:hypothetical protein